MERMIYCNDFTCKHNDGGIACLKDEIHLEIEFGGEYEDGKPIGYNACEDYEVKKDARTD